MSDANEPQDEISNNGIVNLGIDTTNRTVIDEKNRIIELLNETAKAFQLEVGVLQQENKQLTSQLEQKDITIQGLQYELRAKDKTIADHVKSVEAMKTQVILQNEALEELRSQLKTSDLEFDALKAHYEVKDGEFQAKIAENGDKLTQITGLQNENDRLHVIVRKYERAQHELEASKPIKVDACLSARDYSENQLISLRDDAIAAKTKELALVTAANEALRSQLDAVEAEVEQLQSTLSTKEMDMYRKTRKIDKLERQVASLEALQKQAQGREFAIELSTKQNTQLLQCLQAQEAKTGALQDQVATLTQDLNHVKESSSVLKSESAAVEIEYQLKSKTVERQSSNLAAALEKVQKEREKIRLELTELRHKTRLELEAIQEELVMRRNKQYELTLKVQECESEIHELRQKYETTDEALQATNARMIHIERLYNDAKRWKDDSKLHIETLETQHKAFFSKYTTDIKALENNQIALEAQILELQTCIKKQNIAAQEAIVVSKSHTDAVKALNLEKKDLLDRIHHLVAETNKETKLRVSTEMDYKVLQEQLDRMQRESQTMLQRAYKEHETLSEKYQILQKQFQQLQTECTLEQKGKSRVMYLNYVSPSSTSLQLNDCWIADTELPFISAYINRIAGSSGLFGVVDLRSNRISDNGIKSLVAIAKPQVVSKILLQDNYISIQGIRQFASGIEALGFNVLVSDCGVIEATMAEFKMMIDISNNKDASVLVHIPTTLPLPSVNKTKVKKTKNTRDPLEDVYGVDLVATILEKKKESLLSSNNVKQSPRSSSLPKL
ncbi:rho-associated protein kinase [Thraustotheca clavata]|uniref:Rho-associated protein kinase n=1 Tax=Thraustotheca clavata TaxID=74557 RepID=A0A1V9ZYS4_9STRA|nr:rho-associated protein kinase [Thraustotheca clavata]